MQVRSGILCFALLALVASSVACTANSNRDERDNTSTRVDPVINKIVITSRDEILWNGVPVSLETLRVNLESTKSLPVEPQLQFVPDMQASYEFSSRVLNVIKDSNVTKFGFVGNEKDAPPERD